MIQVRKKQSRGEETRERILEVTKNLLSDHDYNSVTLDQISHEAEVAKSSLLWHFESKELLMTEAACELFADLEKAVILDRKDNQTLQERLDVFIRDVGDYFKHNPEPKGVLISLIFNSELPEKIHERINTYWDHHINAIQHFFSYPDKPFAKDAAEMILAAIHGCYLQWYLHRDKQSFQKSLEAHFKHFSIE